MGLRGQHGYTLLELVVVVSVIALIAAIAVPASMSTGSEKQLELAAADVANAIRFARSESQRTGEAYGLTVSQATQQVTVKKYDLSTAPISVQAIPVNPVTKQPYDFNVNTRSTTRGVNISNTDDVFNFTDLGDRRSLLFDSHGTPIWIVGSGPTTHLLSDGTIELSHNGRQRIVSVAPITGRVTVQ